MRKNRIYNVLFPLWMLMLFPQSWFIVLPGNFLIDSLVLFVCLCILKIKDKWIFFKNNILKIFLIGIISDIIGSAYMLAMPFIFNIESRMGDEPYLTVPALLLSAVLIFLLNYFYTFKMCDKKLKIGMSLIFAVATAPYTFLIPSSLIYG